MLSYEAGRGGGVGAEGRAFYQNNEVSKAQVFIWGSITGKIDN